MRNEREELYNMQERRAGTRRGWQGGVELPNERYAREREDALRGRLLGTFGEKEDG